MALEDAGQLPTSFLAAPGQVSDWRLALLYDAAAAAGVLDGLPGTADQLAVHLGLDRQALRVLLDALVTWGVVEHGDNGRYLPGTAVGGADEAAVIRHHAGAIRRWSALIDDRLHGVPAAGLWQPTAQQLELWQRALAVSARRRAPAAVDACLAMAPEARTVLDLGGGHGEYAREFTRRGLQATVQDRPETIETLRRGGWLRDVEVFPGDFFETVPEGPFDIICCAGVTQTFGRQRNLDLYRKVRPIISPGGGLAILTFLRGHPLAALFAVQMLIVGNGADTHAEDDYRSWLAETGYGRVRVRDAGEPPHSLVFAEP